MKKVKLLFLSTLIFCTFSMQAFASAPSNGNKVSEPLFENVDGDLSLEEGARRFSPEKECISDEIEKYDKRASVLSAQGFSSKLSMTHYKQKNGYYCGPATVQQTIKYITGTKIAQSTLASELGTTKAGTDMSVIAGVVNNHIKSTGKSYKMRTIPGSQSTYATKVYNALCKGKPVIIDIIATNKDGWNYTTGGHFLNISGIVCNKSQNTITVTDPNSSDSTNNYRLSVVYKVNSNHWRKSYIW